MINKIYEKIKRIIINNYKELIIFLIMLTIVSFPLPIYIYTGGGVIDIKDRVEINNQNVINGSYNLAYVSEIRATVPTYIMSFFMRSWETTNINNIKANNNETIEDIKIRDKLYLEEANQNAIINAYKLAGYSTKIHKTDNYIAYISENADTDLKIGDILLSIENKNIDDTETLKKVVRDFEVNQKVSLKYKRNNEILDGYAVIKEENNNKIIGIYIIEKYDLETDPLVTLKFKENESGPSGGLMTAISIYDKLTTKDLSNNKKIVGTGTIDKYGNIGEIGGVKYKLIGAVKANADIFIVPLGNNYDEVIALKKEMNYNIHVVGAATFEQAIELLNKEK